MSRNSPKTWSSAVAALAALVIAAIVATIAGSRYNLISYPNAFEWLGYLAYVSAAVAVLGLVAWFIAFGARNAGAIRAAVATIVMAVTATLFFLYQVGPPPMPFMHDITTDPDDPPEFIAVLPLRPAGSNSAEYGGAEAAANQRQAHPEVQPLFSTLTPDLAFDRALEVAEDLGWDVVAADRRAGRIEAVDTTPFFRFKDDVVIRVRPDAAGSRIDLRSLSRIGLTDLGKNAARIMTFIEAYPVQG